MSFTLSTSFAILLKAGANVNSTAASSNAIIAKFSDMAEGELNSATRYDWVTNYANVSANFKPILDDTISDLAGMKLISYDMSGYTSRAEAQTMLNVLRDNATRNIEILKDKKNTEVFV